MTPAMIKHLEAIKASEADPWDWDTSIKGWVCCDEVRIKLGKYPSCSTMNKLQREGYIVYHPKKHYLFRSTH